MTMQIKLDQAQQLIKKKQFKEAEKILKTLDHPTARTWLARLQNMQSGQAPNFLPETDNILPESVRPSIQNIQSSQVAIPLPVTDKLRPLESRPPIPKKDFEIIVTTTDLSYPYDVICPVYFQVSNKGLFSSALGRLQKQYKDEIDDLRKKGVMNRNQLDLGVLWYGEWSAGQTQFESAFFVATRELQKRAALVNAHAVVGMRQDIDLDSNGFQFFYLQMYGTAVRFRT